ncbi:MAG: hypothetical protein ABI839_08300, partial [Verrucomicrobiota bacterium]
MSVPGFPSTRSSRKSGSHAKYLGPTLTCLLARSLVSLTALLAPLAASAASGDIYYSEPNRGTITVVKPSGAASLFASGLHPFALAFDGKGNLFVADQQFGHGAARVLKITPA